MTSVSYTRNLKAGSGDTEFITDETAYFAWGLHEHDSDYLESYDVDPKDDHKTRYKANNRILIRSNCEPTYLARLEKEIAPLVFSFMALASVALVFF